MLDTQLHTEHNMDTHRTQKVLCLHPVKVVNPRIVEFILTHDATFFSTNGCVKRFLEPHLSTCSSTKDYKRMLFHRVKQLLKHDSSVDCFFDSNGESVDAYLYVPCNHCILCLHRKSVAFSVKCSMECQQHEYLPLFVTLTYSDENLPPFGLRYSDVQLFLKRLRVNLQRKHNFSGKLTYAACGEYGSHTNRPHYHLLIWNFPRDGEFSNFFKIDDFIRSCWKLGLTQTKQCRDGKAGQYVGKYMAKQDGVSTSFVQPMKRTSICLGLDFVRSVSYDVLKKNPSQVSFKYCDRFDGKVSDLPLTTYYIKRMFPSFMSLPADVRNSLRDYSHVLNFPSLFSQSIDNQLCKLLSQNPYIMSSNFVLSEFELSQAIFHLSRFVGHEIPDFLDNERVTSFHHAMLFSNLPEVNPHDLAYRLEKERAKQKEREVF